MADSFKSFEDLKCWKACRELRTYVRDIVKKFPPEEKFSLADNMKRASRSTTQNIAEGFGRFHYQEFIRFCIMARGSLSELIDQFINSLDDGFITKEEYDKGRKMIDGALALLNGFINYLEKAKKKDEGK